MRPAILLLLLVCAGLSAYCQNPLFSQAVQATGLPEKATDGVKSVSGKSLHFLQQKYEKMNATVEKQSQKMLVRMRRKEAKLQKQLERKDSAAAQPLFAGSDDRYKQLQAKLSAPYDSTQGFPLTEYLPGVDSLQTALRFLTSAGATLPAGKLAAITKAGDELKGLQDRLQKANDIEAFVKQRERQLKEQLQGSPFTRQLRSINKEAFYYSQRVREYKEMLSNKEKTEQKLLGAVRESPLFQSFMKRNSCLAKLFPAPANYGTPEALAGLQTRAAVQQGLQQRFGALPASSPEALEGGGANSYLQQQMQAAQTQLSQLKDRMSRLGVSGGSSDMTLPDFKPNTQHTKSFLQRIEYGMNVQSEKSHSIIPATTDLAFTAGYKLNDKSTIGLGVSCRMGWGREGIRHITLTNEGVGLRSYVDIRAKGNIWLTGGYEMNYMQSFQKYQQLKDLSGWQRSGLVGLTKKYKVGKKENNLQLLWDFLSYQQIPRTPALKVRVGVKL